MARCALAIVSFRCTPFFPSFCGRERPQGLIHVVGHLTCALENCARDTGSLERFIGVSREAAAHRG